MKTIKFIKELVINFYGFAVLFMRYSFFHILLYNAVILKTFEL